MKKETIVTGKTVVATGVLENFTRNEINTTILELGIRILSEDEFLKLIA